MMEIVELKANDIKLMHALLDVFGKAFEQQDVYNDKRPDAAWLTDLLGSNHFISLVAVKNGEVVGGLTAYELKKFEQARREIYIYDLAVDKAHRREGIATALINTLRRIATTRGAYVVIVQADLEDLPAVNLYTKLGIREDVLHFDIAVENHEDPNT